MACLPRRSYCTLDEQWFGTHGPLEADLASSRYEKMSQHVTPGIRGIRSKRQYQRLLKSKGLTDDIPTKELVACGRDRARRERIRERQFTQVTQQFMERARRMIPQLPSMPIPRTDKERILLRQVRRVFQ